VEEQFIEGVTIFSFQLFEETYTFDFKKMQLFVGEETRTGNYEKTYILLRRPIHAVPGAMEAGMFSRRGAHLFFLLLGGNMTKCYFVANIEDIEVGKHKYFRGGYTITVN
jgi:hypothetical protein